MCRIIEPAVGFVSHCFDLMKVLFPKREKHYSFSHPRRKRREKNEFFLGKRPKAIYRLVTAPQGGTQKYTLAFAYDSPR